VLLIIFCFGREIRVAHRFLLCERDTCCSSIFGRGFVLLIVFCFGRGFRAAHRLLLEGVLCFSSPLKPPPKTKNDKQHETPPKKR
jgi:hypothetical protein